LLVLPYTILPEGLNCLFVSPYMKMLRHYLVGIPRTRGWINPGNRWESPSL
jgi:hypothetical protein